MRTAGGRKRTMLPIACALLVATSGCSFLFMERATTAGDPTRVPHCTPNNGMVLTDAVFGALYLSSAVSAAGEGNSEDRGAAAVSAAFGAVMVLSAILHIGEADKCKSAIDAHNQWIVTGNAP